MSGAAVPEAAVDKHRGLQLVEMESVCPAPFNQMECWIACRLPFGSLPYCGKRRFHRKESFYLR